MEAAMPGGHVTQPDPLQADAVRELESELAAVPQTPQDIAATRRARWIAAISVLTVLLGLVAVWWLTPARQWADVNRIAAAAEGLAASRWALPATLLTFVLAGLVVFPVNLLTAATMLVFGPWPGFAYALAGATLSAAVLYEIGLRLARDRVRDLAGARALQVSERIARRGMLAVIFLRIVPVAPFSFVSLVAGASHVSRRDYILGTAIGLAPGVLMAALFIDRAVDALRHPGPSTWLLLAAVVALIAALSLWLHRHVMRAMP
jgi:phospholipase D1/2